MATITPETTVGELVAEDASRTRIFERLGIDYCCGGRRSLADACEAKGLDPQTVATVLEAADSFRHTPGDDIDWTGRSLHELIDHIEDTHHAFLREELPRLTQLLDKVARVHGKATPWIVDVKDIFDELRSELEAHMLKEENVVFPLLRALEKGEPIPATTELGDTPIELMEEEHDEAGAALEQMNALTDGYTPPENACGTFRAALEGLERLEADMHQHVHKENNILFPQARALV